ncbi:MAG: hypothetical protein D6767_05720 [Candidatus Hydrogenedentota bacterium]|nr:MAG: hypothetical protein D6767_05720 [Candidatus Hydrogenedentota bacterium]
MKKLLILLISFSLVVPILARHHRGGKKHHGNPMHHMMRMIDKNHDKKIDKNEWMKHFEEMDRNKDGVLTKDEMRPPKGKREHDDEDED